MAATITTILTLLMLVLKPILVAMAPAIIQSASAPTTATDAAPDPARRDRLLAAVRNRAIPAVKVLLLVVMGYGVMGCASRQVILIPDTQPVQLAEDVSAYVFVETRQPDGTITRVKSTSRAKLHAGGWYVVDPQNR